MRIALIVEGATEEAFLTALRGFLKGRLAPAQMPRIHAKAQDGRIPKRETLQRLVESLSRNYDAVIALTDVYTGTDDFADAADAKQKMRGWVGENPKFHAHAAQHDFEAWLLPFWETIRQVAKSNRNAPKGKPESVNHNKPPSKHINEACLTGRKVAYSKTRDAARILEKNDLALAAGQCPELKGLLNTILGLCGGELLP